MCENSKTGGTDMRLKVHTKATLSDAMTALEKANREVAYQAALEGIVLLENDGCLPVKPGKIALFGAGAGMTIKGGTGSGEVNERHAVSIREGLEMSGFTVTTGEWIDEYARLYEAGEKAYAEAFRKKLMTLNMTNVINLMSEPYQYPFGQPVTKADLEDSGTDTCIYVIARQAGEGADRKLKNKEYTLSEVERQNISLCAAYYEKMIVAVNVGASFDMNFLDEISGINAVVFFAQQGTMGGKAFADLVSGEATPSGKLADTWAQHYEDIPFAKEYSYLNGNLKEEHYKEGIYVGYRYFDSFHVMPKYPIGYGLSYTTFSWDMEEIVVDQTKITVSVRVKNTGEQYAGKEVLQLYVSCPEGRIEKEYQKLAAFAKTDRLKPGESQIVTLQFDFADLASYSTADAGMILEAGEYRFRLGNSSRNTEVCAVVELDEEVVTKHLAHICERLSPVEELHQPKWKTAEHTGRENTDGEHTGRENSDKETNVPENVAHRAICATDFETIEYHYKTPDVYSSEKLDPILNKLSTEELAALTAGAGMRGQKKFFEAPGSAGFTTGKLLRKGIPNVALADGPAGLRLQKRSALTRSGKLKAVDPFISLMNYMPDFVKKLMLADPDKNILLYQFTTAFPVGLALAQSWNTELVEKVGNAVGEEMKAYGVTYWLAPALNIHRNPLCGRNFEYYSEDPLISGKMAAAMTRGVQKNRGCFVTIKHFCCNNQEDNRNRTNANVSERALREIYLRGFEIVVKEAYPGAVMSSYNKVNGEYVNNSYDLLTKVLRNEWGFDGLVMTDWFATGKGLGDHAKAIAAGNDLLMPGGDGAVKAVTKAVQDGVITVTDVRRCAANVLHGIMSSRIYYAFCKKNGTLLR